MATTPKKDEVEVGEIAELRAELAALRAEMTARPTAAPRAKQIIETRGDYLKRQNVA